MQLSDFFVEFQNLLQRDDPVSLADELKDMEEWDSMSVMAYMVWLDKKFGIKHQFATIAKSATVEELVALTQGNVS